MIWVYRTFLVLNAMVLALTLFVAMPVLARLIDRGTTALNVSVAASPIPQVAGLWFAGKLRGRDLAGACWLLFGQFAIVFGLIAGAVLMLLAAMPE